jgi:hypothetical protein
MRARIANVVVAAATLAACSKSENAGAEEARKQAEAELKAKVEAGGTAVKMKPPVPGQATISCEQLIDLAAFQTALGEVEPLGVKDTRKGEPEAASSCALTRGGKRPTEAEQKAILKKEGRLGVMAGDELCNVTAYCWTIEDQERFKTKCQQRKDQDDDTMGSYACKQVVAVGADDVFVFRFFDADTKCILQVKGGPSNVDNEMIRKCAIAARDTITPARIDVNAAPPPAAEPSAEGSAEGSGSAN